MSTEKTEKSEKTKKTKAEAQKKAEPKQALSTAAPAKPEPAQPAPAKEKAPEKPKQAKPRKRTSSKPRKQRKKIYRAKLHARRRRIRAPLSKELRKSQKQKTVAVRRGDEVKLVRGARKITGAVEVVDLKTTKIFVKGATKKRNDGSEVMYPIDASNVIITKLNTEDKRRFGNAPKKD